jgi:TolB-like protein/tetratricopeptide (TPR) repeat protein
LSSTSHAVFISYASQDAEAAGRICEALRAAGIEVWFDQSELRGGDAWDQKIRRQIRDCALFVPIISAHTQSRPEGYFRLEWKLAVDRSHLMAAEKAFLVPVVVDATTEPEALVPTQFRDVQWTRISAGEALAAFVDRIAALLNQPVVSHVVSAERGVSRPLARRLPIVLTALSVTAVVALVIATAMHGGWLSQKPVPKVEAGTASPPRATTPAPIPEKSVAVLPFADMSEKHDQEYFSDGLSEELIDLLTKIPDLRVPARTSSFYFKGKSEDIPTIARRLMVAHVLEGSIRKSGDRLRVTAQLVRADNGYHLWSETYDRKMNDVFKVQDEIAAAVVNALKGTLLKGVASRVSPTVSTDAYTTYLQARSIFLRGNSDVDMRKAADYLHRAITLDPKFAPAWAELSFVRLWQTWEFPFEGVADEARRTATRALALDPSFSEAHVAAGRVRETLDWDWTGADTEFKQALKLDGSNARVVRAAADVPLNRGEFVEAIRLYELAQTLDPLDDVTYSELGWLYYYAGRLPDAEAAYRRALDLNPEAGGSIVGAHWELAMILLAGGKLPDALYEMKQERSAARATVGFAIVYFALQRREESDAAIAAAERDYASRPAPKYWDGGAVWIACAHAYRGEVDQALAWLERAYERRDFGLVYLKGSPLLRNLEAHPRYKAVLRKMNLPE